MERSTGKSYINWTTEMDRTLSNILLEEHGKGHKAPNGWKPIAFTTAIKGMKDVHNMEFTKEKIMARLKTWNKYFKEVSAMLDTSGFGWDWERNMVKVDSEEVWANYVTAHPTVKHYKDKIIINWSDLGILCGNDKATGTFAATANETVDATEETVNESVGLESQNGADSASVGGGSRQRKRKAAPAEIIADAINNMATTMQMAVAAITKPIATPTNSQCMFEALSRLTDLSEAELLKIMDLLGGSISKYETFMALLEHMRVAWIYLQLYHH